MIIMTIVMIETMMIIITIMMIVMRIIFCQANAICFWNEQTPVSLSTRTDVSPNKCVGDGDDEERKMLIINI